MSEVATLRQQSVTTSSCFPNSRAPSQVEPERGRRNQDLYGKLALPDYGVDIDEHLRFSLALSDEDFDRCPIAEWLNVETAACGLRESSPMFTKVNGRLSNRCTLEGRALASSAFFQVEQKTPCI